MLKQLEELNDLATQYVSHTKDFYMRLKELRELVNEKFATIPELKHISITATEEGLLRIEPHVFLVKDGQVVPQSMTISADDLLRIAAAIQQEFS